MSELVTVPASPIPSAVSLRTLVYVLRDCGQRVPAAEATLEQLCNLADWLAAEAADTATLRAIREQHEPRC